MLDLGCSTGYLAALLSDRGYQVTGVERPGICPSDFPHQVRLIEYDLESGLPSLHEKFDYVVCADVLEHLRDPLHVLRQARDLLAPDGSIAASLPNSGNLYFRLNVLAGRFPKHDRGLFDRTHIHFFMWDGWVRLFADAGLEIYRVQSSAMPFSLVFSAAGVANALERISYWFARLRKTLFAYQFVLLARPLEQS